MAIFNRFINKLIPPVPEVKARPSSSFDANEIIRQMSMPDLEPKKPKYLPMREMQFEEFIGQENLVKRLRGTIDACKDRDEVIPHTAFIGDPGLGKTSLAACAASWACVNAVSTVGGAIQSMDDIAEMIDFVGYDGMIFIDEAHALARKGIVSEFLPLLEDWKLYTSDGARIVDPFTMIFATTSYSDIDEAIRSRMDIEYVLQPYTIKDLAQIIDNYAIVKGYKVENSTEIAKRSRGNPREAKLLAATVGRLGMKQAFELLEIDKNGLRPTDRKLLSTLANGPLSAKNCSLTVGLDSRTYEATIEKFLFKSGYISISSKGRSITDKGRDIIDKRRSA